MAALSIAILGKNKEPVYMKQFNNTDGDHNMMEEDLFLPLATSVTTDNSKSRTVGGFECSAKHQVCRGGKCDRKQ